MTQQVSAFNSVERTNSLWDVITKTGKSVFSKFVTPELFHRVAEVFDKGHLSYSCLWAKDALDKLIASKKFYTFPGYPVEVVIFKVALPRIVMGELVALGLLPYSLSAWAFTICTLQALRVGYHLVGHGDSPELAEMAWTRIKQGFIEVLGSSLIYRALKLPLELTVARVVLPILFSDMLIAMLVVGIAVYRVLVREEGASTPQLPAEPPQQILQTPSPSSQLSSVIPGGGLVSSQQQAPQRPSAPAPQPTASAPQRPSTPAPQPPPPSLSSYDEVQRSIESSKLRRFFISIILASLP